MYAYIFHHIYILLYMCKVKIALGGRAQFIHRQSRPLIMPMLGHIYDNIYI